MSGIPPKPGTATAPPIPLTHEAPGAQTAVIPGDSDGAVITPGTKSRDTCSRIEKSGPLLLTAPRPFCRPFSTVPPRR